MANRNRMILFLLSLTVLSFFVNFMIEKGFRLSSLQIDLSRLMGNLTDEQASLWLYTIIQRTKQFILILLLMKLFPVSYVINGLILLAGGFIGVLFSVETFYDGFSGILYTILCFFPHYIFYFINVKMLSEYYGKNYVIYHNEGGKLKIISNFALNIFIFLCGLVSEIVINQIFLKKFFLYLVEK